MAGSMLSDSMGAVRYPMNPPAESSMAPDVATRAMTRPARSTPKARILGAHMLGTGKDQVVRETLGNTDIGILHACPNLVPLAYATINARP